MVKAHTLIRKFRAESKKLSRVLNNAILVDKFMKCLVPSFALLVCNRLCVNYGHYCERGRHRDDKDDLPEVYNVVRQLLDENAAAFDDDWNGDIRQNNSHQPIAIEMPRINKELASVQNKISSLDEDMFTNQSHLHLLHDDWPGNCVYSSEHASVSNADELYAPAPIESVAVNEDYLEQCQSYYNDAICNNSDAWEDQKLLDIAESDWYSPNEPGNDAEPVSSIQIADSSEMEAAVFYGSVKYHNVNGFDYPELSGSIQCKNEVLGTHNEGQYNISSETDLDFESAVDHDYFPSNSEDEAETYQNVFAFELDHQGSLYKRSPVNPRRKTSRYKDIPRMQSIAKDYEPVVKKGKPPWQRFAPFNQNH